VWPEGFERSGMPRCTCEGDHAKGAASVPLQGVWAFGRRRAPRGAVLSGVARRARWCRR
jgi:hypothetical protein